MCWESGGDINGNVVFVNDEMLSPSIISDLWFFNNMATAACYDFSNCVNRFSLVFFCWRKSKFGLLFSCYNNSEALVLLLSMMSQQAQFKAFERNTSTFKPTPAADVFHS